MRAALREQLDPAKLDGIISMHLLENDPALSKPITDDPAAPNPGAGDWFVLIDATDVGAVPAAAARFTDNVAFKPLVISSGVYRLMWDLAKSDLPRALNIGDTAALHMLHCRIISANINVHSCHALKAGDRAKLPLCMLWNGSK